MGNTQLKFKPAKTSEGCWLGSIKFKTSFKLGDLVQINGCVKLLDSEKIVQMNGCVGVVREIHKTKGRHYQYIVFTDNQSYLCSDQTIFLFKKQCQLTALTRSVEHLRYNLKINQGQNQSINVKISQSNSLLNQTGSDLTWWWREHTERYIDVPINDTLVCLPSGGIHTLYGVHDITMIDDKLEIVVNHTDDQHTSIIIRKKQQ